MARSARNPAATPLPLHEFEGAPVVERSFSLTKANDALRDAVSPESVAVGADVYVLLRGRITEVGHGETSPESDVRARRHHVVCQEAGFVSEVDAKTLLADERERRRAASASPAASDEDEKQEPDEAGEGDQATTDPPDPEAPPE